MTLTSLLCNLIAGKRLSPRKRPATRLTVESLEDRWVPSTLHVDPTGTFNGQSAFTTIQAAVNAANAGDTVSVDAGTYQEQVTITTNNLKLVSAKPQKAVIEAPATLAGSEDLVTINGATGVVVNGFTITTPSTGGPASIDAGVAVLGAGSATIENNQITRIQDSTFGANQDGFGVRVGSETSTGSATIVDNTITAYQKGGVIVTNTGSSAQVADNSVVGVGSTSAIAQNGIQISAGATGSVTGNVVTGNVYASPTQPAQFAAADILIIQAGNNVAVDNNLVVHADVGIWVLDTAHASISSNLVVGTNLYGIALDTISTGSNSNTVSGNVVFHNGGDGIDLFGSSSNLISNNASYLNTGNGFTLDAGSTNNVLVGNISALNGGDGIAVTDSSSTGNTIAFNISFDNAGLNLFDATVGSGTAGTGNTYAFNLT
jgi:parallel beta-helix repeat protein